MKTPHPDALIPHRGYSGPGREAAAGSAAAKTQDPALKEKLHATTDSKIGSEDNKENYNIWLPEEVLPGFKDFTTKFYREMFDFTKIILEALVLGVGFDDSECKYTMGLHTGLDGSLRLLHYPSTRLTTEEEGSRLGTHTDWDPFTLLFQDDVGGLEFEDIASGNFMPALPQGDKIYINIGDVLKRVTNGRYPASMHRVTTSLAQTPDEREAGEVPERYSIAYFVAPDPDAIIRAQPSRVIADKCLKYEPVVFKTYSEKLFKASRKD